jgi:hypothetical protein
VDCCYFIKTARGSQSDRQHNEAVRQLGLLDLDMASPPDRLREGTLLTDFGEICDY